MSYLSSIFSYFMGGKMAKHPRPEQTHQEQETRTAAPFEEMEYSLPSLPYRVPRRFVANLTSYLGARNPFYRAANPKTDDVWLFDNTAYRARDASGQWTAEFVAAYFRKGTGKNLGSVVADLAEKLGLASGSKEEATVRERLQPFVDTILPAVTATVAVEGDGRRTIRLGPSGRSGISSEQYKLPGASAAYENGRIVENSALKFPEVTMQTAFAEPEGWAVISDVDDTIKVTMTPSPLGILRTTFVDEPQVVSGMPELYSYIHNILRPTWFYLSASPYNLYTFLRNFRSQHYPVGTIILRDASWMTLGGFLASLTLGTQDYKVSRMEKINTWLPHRKFICIGDSTQTDPESYGEIYRNTARQGWVKAIYIRKVTGVAELNKTDKNSDERFEKAFDGVPREVWRVFEDPAELYAAVDALTRGEVPVTTVG